MDQRNRDVSPIALTACGVHGMILRAFAEFRLSEFVVPALAGRLSLSPDGRAAHNGRAAHTGRVAHTGRPAIWMLQVAVLLATLVGSQAPAEIVLNWEELPSIPNELGVAGPIVGVQSEEGKSDVLLVGGGANFPQPVWESSKQWHDDVYALMASDEGEFNWRAAGTLPRPLGYAACVSTDQGVLVMGGNDAANVFDDVFLLHWTGDGIEIKNYPKLPKPCVHGQAVLVGSAVYLAGGQTGSSLDTAMNNFWKLDLSASDADLQWEELPPVPGPTRALNLTLAQHNGFDKCIYVISGRTAEEASADAPRFLKDVWEFNPVRSVWRQRSDVPACVMAGTGLDFSNSYLYVLGGDSGELFNTANDLKDDHPGFQKRAFAYHTITDRWIETNATPANHVTTQAVMFNGRLVVPSGEVRPRVRSPKVWAIQTASSKPDFGVVNYTILVLYLAAMVGVGVYFARKNKNTDDYFRGGKQIPWWAAGCSIYATMLSSLTYTGLPSKSFQQDWVVAVLNFVVPLVAFIAAKVALPFYRRIDATSSYEYLEKRFSRPVRLLGSASFVVFHVFRMAVVLALTGLALKVATPLDPRQCVLVMGILSIIYCTFGGIEAVIWTDTIQTVVLLGGAVVAGLFLINGIDGGFEGFLAEANAADKFKWAHFNLDMTSAQVAIWFIIIGSIAQNISTYTADQAVVQRYMTTSTQALAERSIWTNAILVIPTTILFFGIGTALYAFYRSHPDRLDPNITADQVFPLFISKELPIGIAGLIVAGIFAAAQSTVSTSMNSMATTVVTDFLRPFGVCKDERNYLRIAKFLTLAFGVIGTLAGLYFIDPNIKSRFDEFVKLIGLFMGVLGGLFVLGALTKRANSVGALFGAFFGAGVMFFIWKYTDITAYMYTFFGVASCVVAGYLVSLLLPQSDRDLAGLTVYTLPATKD